MHLLAARSTGVAHITPQVDPVPGGPTGEGAREGHSPRRGPARTAGPGPGRGQSRAGAGAGAGQGRGRAGWGGAGRAGGAVRMFGRTSQ